MDRSSTPKHRTRFQRVLEKGLALAMLVGTSPLLATVMVYIKIVSPGPAFFVQRRLGRQMVPFVIYKLRTMKTDAESDALGFVTVQDDHRIIPGGKWLRKFKIDELPQLANVLNGSMAFVGPRPTVQSDYQRMSPQQKSRALVEPGITGLAQINGGASLCWPERIELDLHYINTRSMVGDLAIMVRTLGFVLSGHSDTNPMEGDEWNDHRQSPPRSAA